MFKHLVLPVIAVGAVACALATAPSDAQPAMPVLNPDLLSERVERYFSASAQNQVPGLIHVSVRGETIFEEGYGLANRTTGQPIDRHTIFDIGSLTKQFTAAAVMVLVDRGVLSTDDMLAQYFPTIPDDKASITIHQLLTHSSGLSDETGGFEGNDRGPYISRDAFLTAVFASPLTAAPGDRFEYTNAGYSLLAAIIEDVSGQSYEAFLREAVLTPAGMHHTGYQLLDWSEETAAHGYFWPFLDPERSDQGVFLTRWDTEPVSWRLRGNGGLHANLEDLVRWHRALQDGAILSPEALARYQTGYVPFSESGLYAYGWGVRTSPAGTPVLTHNGGNGIFFAWIGRFVEEDILIIHLTNEARDILEQAGPNVRDMVYDSALEPSPIPPSPVREIVRYARSNPVDAVSDLSEHYQRLYGYGVEYPDIINLAARHVGAAGDEAWELALLELNIELFAQDGLLHFSLGEAYASRGQRRRAIESLRRSIALGAEQEACDWCEPAQAALEALGGSYGEPNR